MFLMHELQSYIVAKGGYLYRETFVSVSLLIDVFNVDVSPWANAPIPKANIFADALQSAFSQDIH